MRKILPFIITSIGLLGFAGVAFALPYFSQTQSMVPGQNDKYNIGTTSPSTLEYNNIYTKNITVSGTCTGCAAASSGSLATSSQETSGQLPFWASTNGTPALLSGGVSTLVYSSSLDRFTATNASTTALTVGTGYVSTALAVSTTTPTAADVAAFGGNVIIGASTAGDTNGTLTYGNVTFANTVTGTGSLVGATAPTFVTSITTPVVTGGTAATTISQLRATSSAAPTTAALTIQLTSGTIGTNPKLTFTASGLSMGTTTGPGAGSFDIASTTATPSFKPQLWLTDSSGGINFKHWTLSSEGGEFAIGTSTDLFATSTNPIFKITSTGNVSIQNAGTFTISSTTAGCAQFSSTGLVFSTGSSCGLGTVTAVSVATANGFAGSSGGGATPALTLTTTITGLLKGNGTAISAAALTDFPSIGANTILGNFTGASGAPTANATSSLFSSTAATTIAYASSTAMSAPNIMATTNFAVGTTTPPTIFSVGNALTNGGLYFTTTGFAIGSSSPQFPWSVTPVLSNLASTFYINASGEMVGYDKTNGWAGQITPTRSFVLSTATTTTWTASTTNTAYSPTLAMPFAGTLRQARCLASTTQAFIGVNVTINGVNVTPSYFVASTTIGVEKFTANNTFNAGDIITGNYGTTTSDANARSVNCTFDITQTP